MEQKTREQITYGTYLLIAALLSVIVFVCSVFLAGYVITKRVSINSEQGIPASMSPMPGALKKAEQLFIANYKDLRDSCNFRAPTRPLHINRVGIIHFSNRDFNHTPVQETVLRARETVLAKHVVAFGSYEVERLCDAKKLASIFYKRPYPDEAFSVYTCVFANIYPKEIQDSGCDTICFEINIYKGPSLNSYESNTIMIFRRSNVKPDTVSYIWENLLLTFSQWERVDKNPNAGWWVTGYQRMPECDYTGEEIKCP